MEKYLNQQSRTRDEFSCVCLHSDRRPDERKENLELFKIVGHMVTSRFVNHSANFKPFIRIP
uniref:Uncharacterized protein n=1 Tax=Romanomermis culicivorax TaxID=13658 RepID=A0A915KFD3_ROMCU